MSLPSATFPRYYISQKEEVSFDVTHGRLVVMGNDRNIAYSLPGAYENTKRKWVELSLTLDTLRRLREAFRFTQSAMAVKMSAALLNWARAAGRFEKQLKEIHERLDTGWRLELPWFGPEDKKPFEHQKVMATVACSLDGAAFLCEMGTGKTRAAIEALRYHIEQGHLECAIVVCPKSVMGTWEREIPTWSTGLEVIRLDGKVQERIDIVRFYSTTKGKPTVFILNYDVLDRMNDVFEGLMRLKRTGMILDEIHRIKNPQTLTAQASMSLARSAAWRLGQSGSLILNGIQDVWAPWYFVDLGTEFGANFVQFRREWLDENPYAHSITPKHGALEGVGAKLRRRGLRYTKAECLDLPPKMYEKEEVEMTKEQKKAYEEMSEFLITELRAQDEEGVATAANQLVSILRLSQITSGHVPAGEKGLFRFLPNPKLDRLEEILREQINERSIIVWARYREDIRAISERMRDVPHSVIQGQQLPRVRDAAEADFKSGKVPLLVANAASGGEGLDLWKASVAIYYSQDYSLKNRAQSEDRCHRKGSEIHNKVTYIDLMCKDSVDEIILAALNQKKSVASIVLDLRRHIGL